MIENNYHTGDCLVSTRKLSRITGISNTTIRMAIGSLVSQNILKKVNNVFIAGRMDFSIEDVKVQTLVEKTAENLKFCTNELTPYPPLGLLYALLSLRYTRPLPFCR